MAGLFLTFLLVAAFLVVIGFGGIGRKKSPTALWLAAVCLTIAGLILVFGRGQKSTPWIVGEYVGGVVLMAEWGGKDFAPFDLAMTNDSETTVSVRITSFAYRGGEETKEVIVLGPGDLEMARVYKGLGVHVQTFNGFEAGFTRLEPRKRQLEL